MPKKKTVAPKKAVNNKNNTNNKPNPVEEEKRCVELFPLSQRISAEVTSSFNGFCQAYGFLPIDLPNIGLADIFCLAENSDYRKLLVTFPARTKAEEQCLRSKLLPQAIQFTLQNKLKSCADSVRLSYMGSVFQKAGLRKNDILEDKERGILAFGEQDPGLEAEMIKLAYDFFSGLDLPVTLNINNIGCKECLNDYWKQLDAYYKNRKRYICEDCKDFYANKSLDFFSCQKVNCQELAADAPQLVDNLCEDCREHFVKILEYLDAMEVPYSLDPTKVSNQEVYNRTIFSLEINDTKKNEKIVLAEGGRLEPYLASLGEKNLAIFGFSFLEDGLIHQMKKNNSKLKQYQKVDVFVAQLGEEARKKALTIFEGLRCEGVKVAHAFWENGLNRQIALANKQKSRFIVIIGQREIIDKTVLIRDIETGAQEIVDYSRALDDLKRRLNKGAVNNHFLDKKIFELRQKSEEDDLARQQALNMDDLGQL